MLSSLITKTLYDLNSMLANGVCKDFSDLVISDNNIEETDFIALMKQLHSNGDGHYVRQNQAAWNLLSGGSNQNSAQDSGNLQSQLNTPSHSKRLLHNFVPVLSTDELNYATNQPHSMLGEQLNQVNILTISEPFVETSEIDDLEDTLIGYDETSIMSDQSKISRCIEKKVDYTSFNNAVSQNNISNTQHIQESDQIITERHMISYANTSIVSDQNFNNTVSQNKFVQNSVVNTQHAQENAQIEYQINKELVTKLNIQRNKVRKLSTKSEVNTTQKLIDVYTNSTSVTQSFVDNEFILQESYEQNLAQDGTKITSDKNIDVERIVQQNSTKISNVNLDNNNITEGEDGTNIVINDMKNIDKLVKQSTTTYKIQSIINKTEKQVEVKLYPEHLGNVICRIEQQANGTSKLIIAAENRETLFLLKESIAELQDALKDLNIKTACSTEFSLEDNNNQHHHDQKRQRDSLYMSDKDNDEIVYDTGGYNKSQYDDLYQNLNIEQGVNIMV